MGADPFQSLILKAALVAASQLLDSTAKQTKGADPFQSHVVDDDHCKYSWEAL